MKSLRRAFTLVEIMIVVLIIGILLAIAVPNFIKARESAREKSCIANLRQIEAAGEQYLMDNKLPSSAPLNLYDLIGTGSGAYIKAGSQPLCPSSGGLLYPNWTGMMRPSCPVEGTNPGHKLP